MYALSSFFINNFTHLHCAARMANLNSLAQLNSLPSYAPRDKTLDVDHNKIKKPLIELAVVRLKELNADEGSMRSTSYHCSTRGGCSANWNRSLIDAGKPTSSTFQWCARPFDDSFTISKLAHHQPSVASAHLSRTQGDSEGVQERWRGQWVRRVGRVLISSNSHLY